MTQLTDDELGALLDETFTAHEHLADPDRARALAAEPRAPRARRGPVLLAAAASVALVAGGTAYLVSPARRPGDHRGPGQTTACRLRATVFAPHVTEAEARAAPRR